MYCVIDGSKFISCDILSKAFISYSNLLISGNELEEDLEILEEASLQVCHPLNSEILVRNQNDLAKRIFICTLPSLIPLSFALM